MSDHFEIEFQNAQTNWEWTSGGLIAPYDTPEGITFNNEFIIPNYSISYPFYSWTNFRILCKGNIEKINLWAEAHISGEVFDTLRRTHQSGGPQSSYGTYESVETIYKDSDRIYFWIDRTNEDDTYVPSQTLFDDRMAEFSVSSDPDIEIMEYFGSDWRENISTILGWNPFDTPLAYSQYAFNVTSASKIANHARWIQGWDNVCVNVLTKTTNPTLGIKQVAILDVFGSIYDGEINDYFHTRHSGAYWLGCQSGKYIYGKIVFSLESHDFTSHELLYTTGFKSCQVSVGGMIYV